MHAYSLHCPTVDPVTTTIGDFSATTLTGQEQHLSEYAGQVLLVVNTATKCGLTPQFEGLELLHGKYSGEGFSVLGFPCNQFAKQEPRNEEQIGEFCERNYGVTFPMFAKVDVNGRDAHPLWRWLRGQQGGLLGDRVKWNFTKFLIGRDGRVLGRYSPSTLPEKIAADIETALDPVS
jgi:glutathione peroxidase